MRPKTQSTKTNRIQKGRFVFDETTEPKAPQDIIYTGNDKKGSNHATQIIFLVSQFRKD